jgi:SnoaL-like protein
MNHDLDRHDATDAITRLIFAYCEGIDTGRFDDTARLFSDGTWYLNEDTPISGFNAVASFLHDNVILYDGVPGTRHTVSNIVIDLGDDRRAARARSYVIVFQTVPGNPPHIMFQGAYDDTFARTDGTWHFNERRIHTDGTGDMTLHLKGLQAQAVGTSA